MTEHANTRQDLHDRICEILDETQQVYPLSCENTQRAADMILAAVLAVLRDAP